ncbi:polysaccharide pyruvyl transferase family protein [uncultured Algibacter sp.]|uniref:polysaccharide pyruvyl transferase family protein n=1 Tax=uncultured Algibacter sp. TaxID=298659 RepID=UPI00262F4B7E|nr:polysaccharide pyruvyl transferase family protein [uncultured Algibacter sp.]
MKKYKIAILTQPLKTNYGGILQAYALQKILIESGNDVVTINRKDNTYSKFRLKISRIKNQLINKKNKTSKIMFSEKQMGFITQYSSEFINNKIVLSELINSNDKISNHFKKNYYNTLVVGSDQTWRPKYSPNIYNFYLDFLNNNETKRVAYASSFGVDNWEYTAKQSKKCKKLALKFDAISVREKSGINLCKKHLGVQAKLVLDPTLLLSKEEYIDLFKSQNLPDNKNKLYTYVLDRSNLKNDIIQYVSRILHLKEFKNQPKESWIEGRNKNLEDYVYPPVEGWIKGFYDAEFVITDSFHGTLFSILFNKPFLVIPNVERGVGRFTSILSQFGLENRMVTNSSEVSESLLTEKINFDEVNSKLQNLKIQSLDFLKDNI